MKQAVASFLCCCVLSTASAQSFPDKQSYNSKAERIADLFFAICIDPLSNYSGANVDGMTQFNESDIEELEDATGLVSNVSTFGAKLSV